MKRLKLYLGIVVYLFSYFWRENDKTSEGKYVEITFEEYLKKVNERALEGRVKKSTN
jgi:hypothetical protein